MKKGENSTSLVLQYGMKVLVKNLFMRSLTKNTKVHLSKIKNTSS